MASITITKWIILSINILIIQTLTLTHAQQVPCFFIFGDSQMDNGNNNLLPTSAKANYRPYGIDFPGAVPTGRFTNGKNIADFLAELLDFSDPIPPFASTRGSDILRGLNYGSGAAGILDISGIRQGPRFSMNDQLANHRATTGQIAALFRNRTAADNYLRQCLYVVNIGSNDYINNYYYQRPRSLSNLLYTPDQFADQLIAEFSRQLRRLYDLGSRKVAVYGIGLIGCIPQEILLYPITNGSPCVDKINVAVGLFNDRLMSLVNNLNNNLPNAQFTYINATSIALGDPSLIGVKVLNAACCEVQRSGPAAGQCLRDGAVCGNRQEYIFFDNFHPTEISNNVTAMRSYRALVPADASPVDIERLVRQ
ncbi:GDSL esterase/lipase At1g29670-like [Salvia hispanica]|uniref:GDSL esterase/lipase At1g29670-like n=1 Tax=Salvia hispanica TaxID=49212 RepID=UPI002009387E|nr:GDSL esterase/lipase At1g29670-like [Salvia hispanica]